MVIVAVVLWPSKSQPRAREYRDFAACLLTDGQGLAGEHAGAVWAGMQDASASTRVRVQYVQVIGEATVANARPYLAGLLQRRCDVVVAVGSAQVGAVAAVAPQNSNVRFVVLVDAEHSGAGAVANVTSVPWSTGDQVRNQVREAVVANTS